MKLPWTTKKNTLPSDPAADSYKRSNRGREGRRWAVFDGIMEGTFRSYDTQKPTYGQAVYVLKRNGFATDAARVTDSEYMIAEAYKFRTYARRRQAAFRGLAVVAVAAASSLFVKRVLLPATERALLLTGSVPTNMYRLFSHFRGGPYTTEAVQDAIVNDRITQSIQRQQQTPSVARPRKRMRTTGPTPKRARARSSGSISL